MTCKDFVDEMDIVAEILRYISLCAKMEVRQVSYYLRADLYHYHLNASGNNILEKAPSPPEALLQW